MGADAVSGVARNRVIIEDEFADLAVEHGFAVVFGRHVVVLLARESAVVVHAFVEVGDGRRTNDDGLILGVGNHREEMRFNGRLIVGIIEIHESFRFFFFFCSLIC